ncbi:helix-turn-helix domain-containing protein [Corynebacterium lizhenjunii]|uniref:helix-turn-helix domain-containing protein n=1 Tax=Corynebacterium lizhenjunii TaxID=2709394 RepID=UPI0013EAAC8F
MEKLPGLLTTEQASEYLGVHRTTLHRYRTTCGLRVVKLPGRVMYREDDLQDFLTQQAKTA